jgi:hypothetical protein
MASEAASGVCVKMKLPHSSVPGAASVQYDT